MYQHLGKKRLCTSTHTRLSWQTPISYFAESREGRSRVTTDVRFCYKSRYGSRPQKSRVKILWYNVIPARTPPSSTCRVPPPTLTGLETLARAPEPIVSSVDAPIDWTPLAQGYAQRYARGLREAARCPSGHVPPDRSASASSAPTTRNVVRLRSVQLRQRGHHRRRRRRSDSSDELSFSRSRWWAAVLRRRCCCRRRLGTVPKMISNVSRVCMFAGFLVERRSC